jgi:hypothetical protein
MLKHKTHIATVKNSKTIRDGPFVIRCGYNISYNSEGNAQRQNEIHPPIEIDPPY